MHFIEHGIRTLSIVGSIFFVFRLVPDPEVAGLLWLQVYLLLHIGGLLLQVAVAFNVTSGEDRDGRAQLAAQGALLATAGALPAALFGADSIVACILWAWGVVALGLFVVTVKRSGWPSAILSAGGM